MACEEGEEGRRDGERRGGTKKREGRKKGVGIMQKDRQCLGSMLTKGLSSYPFPNIRVTVNNNIAHLGPCCQGNLHDPVLAEVALIGGGGSDTVSLICLQVDIQTHDGDMETAHTKENSRHVVVEVVASMTILASDL